MLPSTFREGYDVREVIARLVDGSKFREFKARYGTTLVCGFARLWGYPVGILANNGVLFSESALKATHFIELCDQRGIPLLFLQNITGFMVGREAEAGGIAQRRGQDGACRGEHARAQADAGHRRLLRRGQLCHVRARLRLALPVDVAQRAHLGHGRGAGRQRAAHHQAGAACSARAKRRSARRRREAFMQPILDKYENEGNPYHSTARLWDDGVIDPLDTRQRARTGALGGAQRPG